MYQIERAIKEIISNDDFFPRVSRIRKLALSFKKEPSPLFSDSLQLEEVTAPAGSPTTKEDFFAAMDKLMKATEVTQC